MKTSNLFTLAELKPQSKQLVYDLLTKTGVDTRDWSNFKGDNPATNPKYCYDWAFWDAKKKDTVVLCLWFSEMREQGDDIYQELNYRMLAQASGHGDPSIGVRAKRARRMDMAFQLAYKHQLPVHVIIVDGIRRGEAGADTSDVERRMLDPVPWSITAYDIETGQCRLLRGQPNKSEAQLQEVDQLPLQVHPIAEANSYITRIAFNSANWQRPTGEAHQHEAEGTFNQENGFGHEDWLFRNEWLIDGWRYAFIQGVNKSRDRLLEEQTPFDVTLFTIDDQNRRRYVARIGAVECLSDDQADAALNIFRDNRWLDAMCTDIKKVGGNVDVLGRDPRAKHILNVRFRIEHVDLFPPDTFAKIDDPVFKLNRYNLNNLGAVAVKDREKQRTRLGAENPPDQRPFMRKATAATLCTPEHAKIQAKLVEELRMEFPNARFICEEDFVDVTVQTETELHLFEIKSDQEPRSVIRQALGQILEYAYHPSRAHTLPRSLVIVGRSTLKPQDEEYLRCLRNNFSLPLSYRVVPI